VYPAIGINNWTNDEDRERQLGWYREAARRCAHVICDSESTRQDFIKYFDYPEQQTTTVHLGVDARFTPQPAEHCAAASGRHGLTRPYLFNLGLGHANKNLPRLIEGFADSGLATDFDLVLAGPKQPWQRIDLEQTIARTGTGGQVRLLGFVDEADVVPLYAGAAAVVLPSLYEGFGFAILEGMRCGVPVLTSTGGSCPEVASGHAVIVDPLDVSAIGQGLVEAVALSKERREAARLYAESKNWEATVAGTCAVYRKILGQ
jgi:glycosyltransferase involved in cell wall biosynthesis